MEKVIVKTTSGVGTVDPVGPSTIERLIDALTRYAIQINYEPKEAEPNAA